jgi:hypothetical protein
MSSSSVCLVSLGRRLVVGAALGCALEAALPRTADAAEPDKSGERAACADSYRNAQMQRQKGALGRARESLLLCASDRCPTVLQPDCMRWLTEVEAAMPTVTFAAKGIDGKDVTEVRVTLDGQLLRDSLDGKSTSIDPGTHTLRFEHGTEAPIDQSLVIREGEKSRVISVSWAKSAAREGASEHASVAGSSGPPTSAWVFSGIGAASLAAFGVLAVHGVQRRSELEKECFGSCEQGRVDSVKTELAVADVALGAGIVSVGIAAVLFLTSGSSERSTSAATAPAARQVSVGVAPRSNGAAVGISGHF